MSLSIFYNKIFWLTTYPKKTLKFKIILDCVLYLFKKDIMYIKLEYIFNETFKYVGTIKF